MTAFCESPITDLVDAALDDGDGAGEHGVQGEEDVVSLHGDDAHRELVVVLLLHSGKGWSLIVSLLLRYFDTRAVNGYFTGLDDLC